ncbi:MAG: DUF6171 family protein [Oscillospiraceae bacterium]
MTNTKPCTRCLLEAAGRQDILTAIKGCIEKIPAPQRTEPVEYARRLALCADCTHISAGTCLKCGCYPELRAAKSDAHCPLKQRHW